MNRDLTKGPIMSTMMHFAVPMILGNLLQQCYNIADTLIVGRFLGANALAAVGSAFTLMTFLTSILLGLCMGSGAVFSIRFGQHDEKGLIEGAQASFVLILGITLLLNGIAYACLDAIRIFLQVPDEVWGSMREYLAVIFGGIMATFLYFARPLMELFVDAHETEIIAEGVRYLHIEGAFYCGIGCLFLLYGLYRALGKPGMSVVLTVISLGTRVVLAYILSAIPTIGVTGIWWSVPIGWILADLTGLVYYKTCKI